MCTSGKKESGGGHVSAFTNLETHIEKLLHNFWKKKATDSGWSQLEFSYCAFLVPSSSEVVEDVTSANTLWAHCGHSFNFGLQVAFL